MHQHNQGEYRLSYDALRVSFAKNAAVPSVFITGCDAAEVDGVLGKELVEQVTPIVKLRV